MLALITATKNSIRTLPKALDSAKFLSNDAKIFLVDGDSRDGTREIIERFVGSTGSCTLINQEGTGLYQAINQGISVAIRDKQVTHIGMLHSDDCLLPSSYERYRATFASDSSDFFYSDIQFHNRNDTVVREWHSGEFSKFKLLTGWMPPHTSVVVRKSIYEKFGLYDPSFGTAADYEWIVRVLRSTAIKVRYFPKSTVSMQVGGASGAGIMARIRANSKDGAVWAQHSIFRAAVVRVCKPLRKIGQFKLMEINK